MSKALKFMWEGGNTRRFHTVPTVLTDTVGHHSYNVACIIMHLRPDASAALLRAALKHDVAECRTGDMPAPVKRALPDYHSRPIPGDGSATFREVFDEYEDKVAKEHGVDIHEDLSTEDKWLLKFADALDGMRFCLQERKMGNMLMVTAYENFRAYTARLLYGTEKYKSPAATLELVASAEAEDLFWMLEGEWERVHRK